MCFGIKGSLINNCIGGFQSVIQTQECFTIGIKTFNIGVYVIKSIMIPTFSEFGLVIECASFNFNLPGREIPLEVCIVFLGIPEAPLYKRMDFERFGLVGKVFKLHQLNFGMGLIRYKA